MQTRLEVSPCNIRLHNSSMNFTDTLLTWYQENQRRLPWRNIREPYRIWLSEIMLQQTRVSQMEAYYRRFLQRFPTVEALAKAPEREVLKYWQGLGYYSRARNLHASAKKIFFELGNRFPSTYREIIRLKGVGEYTAAAIASFAFGESTPVLDGNVFRLYSRYFGISEPKNNSRALAEVKRLLHLHIVQADPAQFNQAVMEFGALQCTPSPPDCLACPLRSGCYAYEHGKVDVLPTKTPAVKQKKRYFHYFIFLRHGKTLIVQRKEKDIWQKLYEFPLIETTRPYAPERIRSEYPAYFLHASSVNVSNRVEHTLSHQKIMARFYTIEVPRFPFTGKDFQVVSLTCLEKYPFPQLIKAFLDTLLPSLKVSK